MTLTTATYARQPLGVVEIPSETYLSGRAPSPRPSPQEPAQHLEYALRPEEEDLSRPIGSKDRRDPSGGGSRSGFRPTEFYRRCGFL